MPYNVTYTRSAERDRDGMVRYLLGQFDSPQAAKHFLDALDSVIDGLERNPLLYGAVKEEWLAERGYRRAFFMNYVVVFLVEGNAVVIARIFHQRQDYAKFL